MVSFVATPIGNLKDITLRALETLKEADVIFCEDTRHTIKLLNAYEIKKPLYSCHKFNETEAAEKILEASKRGEKVAVVSDSLQLAQEYVPSYSAGVRHHVKVVRLVVIVDVECCEAASHGRYEIVNGGTAYMKMARIKAESEIIAPCFFVE